MSFDIGEKNHTKNESFLEKFDGSTPVTMKRYFAIKHQ